MNRYLIFLILSIPVILISRKSLLKIKSHGFFRFFAWEGIVWVFSSNYTYWFVDPFCLRQIISWLLLIISVYLVAAGVILMTKKGKPHKDRNEDNLFEFEKTTELVDTGIFSYIRHPLYASLLYLLWAIFLKHPDLEGAIVTVVSSAFLYFTAAYDEKECIAYFGDSYIQYKKKTRMFIPYIF